MIVTLHLELDGPEHLCAAAISSVTAMLKSYMHLKISAMPEVRKREPSEEAPAPAAALPSSMVRKPLTHPDDGHAFVPNPAFPFYCGECGFRELMHNAAVRSAGLV